MTRRSEHDELPDITSTSNPLLLVPIDLFTGRIYLTTAPGYKSIVWFQNRGACRIHRDMAKDVGRLRANGIDRLVTLMAGDEILDAEMHDLEPELARNGMQWTHLPLPRGAGEDRFFREDLSEVAKILRRDLKDGKAIAFHVDQWEYRMEVYMPSILLALDSMPSAIRATAMVKGALGFARAVSR